MNNAHAAIAPAPPTTIRQIIDMFWQTYAQNLNNGAWNEVTMPLALKSVIGEKGVKLMAARFW